MRVRDSNRNTHPDNIETEGHEIRINQEKTWENFILWTKGKYFFVNLKITWHLHL